MRQHMHKLKKKVEKLVCSYVGTIPLGNQHMTMADKRQ